MPRNRNIKDFARIPAEFCMLQSTLTVRTNVEEIRQAIRVAVDKLNKFLEKIAMELDHDEMVDEISELNKN